MLQTHLITLAHSLCSSQVHANCTKRHASQPHTHTHTRPFFRFRICLSASHSLSLSLSLSASIATTTVYNLTLHLTFKILRLRHPPLLLLLPMRFPFVSSRYSHHCSSIKFQHSSLGLFCSSSRRPRSPRMESPAAAFRRSSRKEKVVVIMGATGTGKSRLSIDLATHFPFLEIINSDKMQVYRGLDITTNKIPVDERNGVVHHLLGEVDPGYGEFTPIDFRLRGGSVISDIASRKKLPIVVGGSNSFVHALLTDRFDPELDVFYGLSSSQSPADSLIPSELRYKCCFLWVDVSFPVLSDYLGKRVDEMLDSGMVEELAEFFDPDSDDLDYDSANRTGLRKAIGVPEFDRYFKKYPPPRGLNRVCSTEEDLVRKAAYEEAVRAIKENTCELVKRQMGKILRLKAAGWDIRRVDATEAFRAAMAVSRGGGERWLEIWVREVVEPSVKIVKRFLRE